MKTKSLVIFFMLCTVFVWGQQLVSIKGDRIDLGTVSLEPWNIDGTGIKASLNNQNIYQNGKIGINTGLTVANAALDVINDSGNSDASQYSGSNDNIRITTFTTTAAAYNPQILLRRASGSKNSASALLSGNVMGSLSFNPYIGGSWAAENSTYLGADYLGDGASNLTALKIFTSGVQRTRVDEKGNMLLYGGDAYNLQSTAATENLDVVGNMRVRTIPRNTPASSSQRTVNDNYDASTQANRVLVMKEDGTLGYRYDYAPAISYGGVSLDQSGIKPEALPRLYYLDWLSYFIGQTVNITLPNPADFTGREFSVYFYGGGGNNASTAVGTLNFNGTIVSDSAGSVTLGSYVTISSNRVTISGSGGEFRTFFQYQKISLFSTGTAWAYIGPR